MEQWPIATRDQVVSAFKNVGDEMAGEAPFRTLRQRGAATKGTRLRSRRDGHIIGGLVIYSSLNVDAARLARLGLDDEALKLAKDAAAVERSDIWRRMLDLLAAGTVNDARDAIAGVVRQQDVHDLLRAISRMTERLRIRHKVLKSVYEVITGAVSERHAGYVVVRTANGEDTAVPRWLAAGVARDHPGDLVALLNERLGARKAILEALPAIDVADPEDASGYSPFDRTDPRNRLSDNDTAHLQGEPAPLRVLVPVTIAG